ncbi:MAG: penicillin-binding protein 2 [Propionibacteriaceae bacterium]|jgi:peptidoglycan glycosyltransferase|nr:penicillin-binding protein 2 [Propionibacteriaceae bacterium]
MNKHIRHVGWVAALMVFALLGNLTYLNVAQQDTLEASSYNTRAREAEFDIHRGQILAGDTVIADSVPSTDNSDFTYQRIYTNGPLYAPITGFYSYIYASSRVENSYNSYLVGTDSSQWSQRIIDMMSGRTPEGASVVTTISPGLQQAAATALQGYSGAIVAMDPHSGAIKALASTPSFDPNLLASHDLGAEQTAWDQLVNDPAGPMLDRGTREIHPPGSTFKLVVAAAALEAGYSADTMIDTPETVKLPGSTATISNSTNCGNTQVTLARALQLSCNTAFANLGLKLGTDAIREQAEQFGFNSETLPDLGGATSGFPKKLTDAELMQSSIGQNSVTASPLQMAMVASSFLNNGMLADPYIVDEVRAPDLSVIHKHETKTTKAISPATAATLQQMMISVVTDGIGGTAKIPGVTVGGKSGTAETVADAPTLAWFVSFALDPDIVVVVFLQKSDTTPDSLWGSGDAAPLAKQVLQASR